MRPTVVFDFDGTVALGRGPLEAYATCLGELTDGEMLTACRTAVERFDAGETNYRDGYDAIQTTARGRGATDDQLSTAYLRSRQLLATDAAEIHPPAGLAEFMTELTTHASCVLATNAPDLGIDRALTVLSLTESLTAVHCSVGKPAGLEPIIATALADGPTLAVGDIWENDLAPAQRLGADTALVGVSQPSGTPTLRGTTLTDLYDDILSWASRAATAPAGARPAERL
ncbi:MAG TPA: HAD family hydrolase [Ruania sp.]|nr:HAD family hydrolase [Ruania sp.]